MNEFIDWLVDIAIPNHTKGRRISTANKVHMRLTRQEFTTKLQQLETAMNAVDKAEDATGFHICDSPLFTIVNDFMDFLCDMCDIPEEHRGDDALSYYIYELNFGANYTLGCVLDGDDNIVPLSNPDELYDDLCKSWGGYGANPKQS